VSDTAPAARRPGRPARLSPESVLDAADALLSSDGVEAVTIRRVAESLGVSPMALYRHVGDKDGLLLALVDRLAQRLEYPPLPTDPRERLMALWKTLYQGLAAHPWLPEVLARRRLMAPSVLWAVEEIHVALCDAGLRLERAVLAYRIVWEFTLGALLVRAGISQGAAGGSEAAPRVPEAAPSVQRALRGAPDPERYPTLARAAVQWRAAHGRDTYLADLGELLDVLLARG
jgi:AcrR family transcriptional regulator